ncbi:MAG: hypothetical protein ACI8PZ_006572 [Myxococcota bacterium]|jgi:hypothetical protein
MSRRRAVGMMVLGMTFGAAAVAKASSLGSPALAAMTLLVASLVAAGVWNIGTLAGRRGRLARPHPSKGGHATPTPR